MKRMFVICMFVLGSAIWSNVELTNANEPQNQQITVTRELRTGYSMTNKTWSYNWYIKVKCGGRPPKEFDLTIEQYIDLYAEAVDAAVGAGKAKETVSAREKKDGDLFTESITVTTTYQGKCIMP
jgi:hypothetical protein